jgi:lactate permease
VAITAAIAGGLGFKPVYAAGVCLVPTPPRLLGAIGIPIVVAAGVTGLDLMKISAIVGRQLPFLSIIVPLWLVVTMSGWKAAREVLPAIIVTGVCFAASQFVVSNFVGPYLPDIIAAIVTIAGLGLFLRFWKPPTVWRFSGIAPTEKVTCLYATGEVIRAWIPYGILAIMVFLWGLTSVKAMLAPIGTTFQWPLLHNLVIKTAPIVAKDTPYPAVFAVNIGTAAGTAIFIAGLLSVLVLPNYSFGGLRLSGTDHQNPEMGHHHFHDSRFGLYHELLRHELHPGAGLHRYRGAVPVLLTYSGLARGVPDGLRHLLQCPVRLLAKNYRGTDRG